MPTFIKTGYWESSSKSYKGWLNLEDLIFNVIPSQAGNAGKYLTTNGSTLSWASVVAPNIYTDNGTLTGNRTVNGGGFSLTLNPNMTFGGDVTGVVRRATPDGSYSSGEIGFQINIQKTFDGSATSRYLFPLSIYNKVSATTTSGTNFYESRSIYIRQDIGSNSSSQLITATNLISSLRNQTTDISSNANNSINGLVILTGQTNNTNSSVISGTVLGIDVRNTIGSGTVTNSYGLKTSVQSTNFTSWKTSSITNHYAFHSSASVGTTSTVSGSITNFYGIYLDTPTVGATGTITNRWGVYAPDIAMNHYINGKLLLGTTTASTFLLDVNGTARVSGALLISGSTGAVAGSLWSDAANGLALSAKAGTTYDFVVYDKNGVRQISFGAGGFVSSAGTYGGIKIGQSGSPSVFLDATFGLAITGTGTSIDSALFERSGLNFAGINSSGNFRIGAYNSTYNASAILEAVSTTKGFLPPRMTTTEKNAIVLPAAGLVVYDTTDNRHYGYNGTTWNAFY